MCGIAGLFGFKGPIDGLEPLLATMNRAMVHRGPDEEGVHIEAPMRTGLAVRRLTIVDPENGSQPLYNEDRSVAVVCNGEIYNHRALREELEKKGHRFRGHSDCEVLAHLYEEEGEAFLDCLNGMFALALLDIPRQKLLLARDPVGMKHLYWAHVNQGLVFASEARCLFAARLLVPRPDWNALGAYFSIGWIQSPRTAFEGLKRLPAGGFLVADGGGVREGRHWRPRFHPAESGRSLADYSEELKALLDGAVASHLDADFPAGLYLSGGWDSSLITLYASRRRSQPLRSYSLVFPDDPAIDESSHSRQVARQAGTLAEEIGIREADVREVFEATTVALEEPNVSCPTVLGYLLARRAAVSSRLVLGGEGADELFGGYDWFRMSRVYRLLRRLPHRVFPAALPFPVDPRIARALRYASAPDADRAQLALRATDTPRRVSRFLKPELFIDSRLRHLATGLSEETRATFRDPVDHMLSLDLVGRLADGILFAHDKTAMAHSLEVRMPFLDRNVVEFAHRLPSGFKIKNGMGKVVLAPLARELPDTVARRKKQGLNVPARMFETESMRCYLCDIILETSLDSGLFDHRRLEGWVKQQVVKPGNRRHALWSISHFCLWWRHFIARDW
ncbi:MAG: asparagine synthase (glutamine-hydrolyzing) [Lysobacterales bacterium]|jgi:asparagine synthase (glutamine-hydrolysing)